MSNHITTLILAFGVWTACAAPAAAQCQTIPDAIERSRPEPLISGRISELVVAPLDAASAGADLVVIATVTRANVYLSDDKCTLYTDYVVAPKRVVAPHGTMRDRPGPAPVIVRTWGGQTTISGVPVRFEDRNLRALQPGRQYLLLLKFDKASGKYEIFDHGTYALEVGPDNRLIPRVTIKGIMDPAIEGADVEEAIRGIQQRRSR